MEKIDKMKVEARALMDNIAVDMLSFYERKLKYAARLEWNRLVGAATMYSVMTDDNPHPLEKYAYPTLRAAAKRLGVDMDFVLACISE